MRIEAHDFAGLVVAEQVVNPGALQAGGANEGDDGVVRVAALGDGFDGDRTVAHEMT